MSNTSETLITLSIELEDPCSGRVPHMHLRGMNWCAGDANGPGNQMDGSRSQADGLGGLTDAPSTSNGAETEVIGHGEGAGMYLASGDMKCGGKETDALEATRMHQPGRWMPRASKHT